MSEDEQVALHLLNQIKRLHDEIERLRAALEYATEYVGRLTSTLAEKHYPDRHDFELLPSLLGRIDQIDNMTCGMARAALKETSNES